ncbi:transporter substrate-binding domain-containing protein [Bermanella marisrubri]|uniref:ABC-type amino acid transport/signal transduction systems, periplasmic component/domain n=1 Tax=Bermanella marisrubri TaxID=207949 RepID=Q1MZB5_9GAMM|nr:transporter substrate-binding domain-containing protein [Bermanella marisrubri]EAT11351.1 ABC-type amino acid transport/signal transduction systems, periplasmic component/domain [Oceanobacter sp. RED65] [Bermanella marisrubri]QIZ85263.1 transporter substrate-binding domain-containing protein [Bermanella marisrubri]
MKITLFAWLVALFYCFPITLRAEPVQPIPIFEYHTFPPMIVSESRESGLTFGFARLLNRSSKQFNFQVELQSLPATLSRLKNGEPAVVLFVSPIWFDDIQREKYLWTEPVYQLRDEVVSRKEVAFEYQGPESLLGLTVAGIEGYTYSDLEPLVQQGRAKRINFANDKEVLKALMRNKEIDIAIVNSGPLSFYRNTMTLNERLHISELPQGEYPVRILVSKALPSVFSYIQNTVENLPNNKMWQDMRALYLQR